MKLKYVYEIRAGLKKYKVIPTSLKTSNTIDGSYSSVYKGRSLNFEELREYVEGDELGCVDWKATARSGKLLVRQYIAEKRHTFTLVMDTNKRMLADAKGGESKYKVAINGAGTFAYLVNLNGDYVCSIYTDRYEGDIDGYRVNKIPAATGVYNIERILSEYEKCVNHVNECSVAEALQYIAKRDRKKSLVLLVTDFEEFSKIPENIITSTMATHELLVMLVSDYELNGSRLFDSSRESYLPAFFSESRTLLKLEREKKEEVLSKGTAVLEAHGIPYVVLDDTKGTDLKIIELLEKKKAIRL